MAYVWLIIAILFLLMEMGSPGLFFFISFFFGGLIAAGGALLLLSIVSQIIIFLIGTIMSLVILRYCVMPFIGKDRPHERTNIYALQGKRGFIVIDIGEKQSGMVKINGSKWAACCINNTIINVGDEVEVIDIRGTHLIVKKIK
jgi:membrane protein implicated in regulation of membrane protease activity